MLKSAVALAFTFVTLGPIAAGAQTAFSIWPERPVHCQQRDYPLVNQVSEVTKVSETEKTAVFRFRTAIGFCDAGYFRLRPGVVNPYVETLRNRIVIFEKEPVRSAVEIISNAEAVITLAFDKKRTFGKRDVATFQMRFFPNYNAPYIVSDAWGRRYWHHPETNVSFPWQVKVSKLEDGGSELEIGLMR